MCSYIRRQYKQLQEFTLAHIDQCPKLVELIKVEFHPMFTFLAVLGPQLLYLVW